MTTIGGAVGANECPSLHAAERTVRRAADFSAASAAVEDTAEPKVLRLADIGFQPAIALLARFGLDLIEVVPGRPIPGSFWGDSEAGVISEQVFARLDTPVHSLLHEASHLIVLPRERRLLVDTDATDCDLEEDATCYLQILLADALPAVGRERLMSDMDAWGYSFRLGSTRAWFSSDADDARRLLLERQIVDDRQRIFALEK